MSNGNLDGQLEALESEIPGATLLSASQEGVKGVALIRLTTGRTLRLTFAGGVDTFPTNEGAAYEPIPNENAAGATIEWAGWDANWLLIATNGPQSLHIRLFGELLAIEEA